MRRARPSRNLPIQIINVALAFFLLGLLVAAANPGIFHLPQGGR
jgi:hypothetical protein